VNDYRQKLDEFFGPQGPALSTLYPAEDDKRVRDQTGRVFTDMLWGAPIRHLANLHAANGYPTYRYVFSRTSKQYPLSTMGAHHGCELAFLFGHPATPDDVDRKVVDITQGYWVHFAAKGDPNGGDLPKWPRFSANADVLVEIENGVTLRENYRAKQYDALDRHAAETKAATQH
jgi:para-nitrobenzyl esterase